MIFKIIFIIWSFISASKLLATQPFSVYLELGAAWQSRNDTQIPPDTGTLFEIDKFDRGPFFHYRAEAYYRLNNSHGLRLVYAPANFVVEGRADRDVLYNGETYSGDAPLTVDYTFNSYRFSYIYALQGFGADQMNIGFTGKIRQADITFKQDGKQSSYDNVGFVPLFYFEYQKSLTNDWSLNTNLDAAAAPQGRAFDLAVKMRYSIEDSTLGLGIRSLEGGADNDKVLTFSWFNYLVAEYGLRF